MEPNIIQPVSNQPVTPAPEKKVGPIIAVLIIVLVLIIAALYLFASRVSEPVVPTDGAVTDDTQSLQAEREVQPVTNNSTDVTSIQSDLDASADGLDTQNF